VPTETGFRIVVPVGRQSEWARNVLAAGSCRIQLHDTVYELDEPAMVPPSEISSLPAMVRRPEGFLGFEYLLLRRFASHPGSLQPPVAEVPAPVQAEPFLLPETEVEPEPVLTAR
jgi:hypothetical protein